MSKAIITLDLINEICHPNGKLGQYADRILESDIINKVNSLTDWARKNNYLVLHVKVGFEKTIKIVV
jgi:nicotinamidase-related amidase